MRLRKNMKRTAAAVLALSMAVSAAAAPASAAYICDVSKGDVVVSVNAGGNKTITVGGVTVDDDGDGKDDIIITGDNTKPTATESLNAANENADEVEGEAENAGENTSEAEKPGENAGETEKFDEGKEKTQDSAAEGKGDEPTSQELLAPEDEQKKDEQKKTEQKPAETQETEQAEKPTDKVLQYGSYDPEAQKEAAKPAAEQKAEEKKAAEEKTYEDTNAPTSLSKSVQTAARNVVKIINDSNSALKVILRNLKVDAGDTAQNAMTIKGEGNVTLELDGKNELTGGSASGEEGNGIYAVERGHYDSYTGKLKIQGKEGSSLSATGGSGTHHGGWGIWANELDLKDATVTATGGAGGGTGVWLSKNGGESNIENSKLVASGGGQLTVGDDNSTGGGVGISTFGKFTVEAGSEVVATGGSDKAENREARGGQALSFFLGSYEVEEGGKLTATGGNAESENGNATGGDALRGSGGSITSSGETTLIGGNAKSGSNSGKAAAGNAISGQGNGYLYFKNVTVSKGTTTALGGIAENTGGTATDGNSLNITLTPGSSEKSKTQLKIEEGGIFITARPSKLDANGNGITGNVTIDTTGGKIKEVENAKVVKKDDGTVGVVGDVVGVMTGGHRYKLTETIQPTCTTPGKRVYTCTTPGHEGETYEEAIEALGHHFVGGVCTCCGAPESSSDSSAVTLTVTGAVAYETSIADGRYIIAVPAETAVLSGCLGNLRELKERDVTTIVFRTQLRETALNIDSMLSLGVDDTLFALTHSGESAELTVGGLAHNEQLR